MDWVESRKKKLKLDEKDKELRGKDRVEFLKNEGISFAERDCPWQAIGRWEEALNIKVPNATPKDLGHEKLLEMKAQALIGLHEWEPAIESAEFAVKIDPSWACAYQTLGRAQLGFGQLEQAVNVSKQGSCLTLNTITMMFFQSFSKAVHLCPEDEELRFEDLNWAVELHNRKKAGNLEWKPVKTPEPAEEDSDLEFELEDGEG